MPALALPVAATEGGDAKLRKLWAEYLKQLEAYRKADEVHTIRRDEFDRAMGPRPEGCARQDVWEAKFKRLWQEHDMEPVYEAWNQESKSLGPIVEAIRKAKAETLFGIGVKLSVVEDHSAVDEVDLQEAIDDALRAIANMTNVDFIGATGPIWEGLS